MTPIGHASFSYIAGNRLKRKWLIPLIAGGVLPDVDFILLPFSFFNDLHRVLTHNIFFVAFVALVFLIVSKNRVIALMAIIGGLMHLFVDAILDSNPSNGTGVALLWPVTDNFFSPFNLLKEQTIDFGWEYPVRFIKAIIPQMIIDGIVLFLALGLYIYRNYQKTSIIKNQHEVANY